MDIKNKNILILGGWGLVGTSILHQLNLYKPKKIIILSLQEQEAKEACQQMAEAYPNTEFYPEWGNIFVREELKDFQRQELLNHEDHRRKLLMDNLEIFTNDILDHSFLNQVISRHKPHIIIDSINTSTALAYQDVYHSYQELKGALFSDSKPLDRSKIEKTLTTLYIPQIIRHIQILHQGMVENKTGVYIKIGTTGTGGMGLNIPYTHSEERPSRVLLSKSSLAGAHTMLMFLMGRTPEGPICKEIKPAAAIAWKEIGFGEIKKQGHPIPLYDCKPINAQILKDKNKIKNHGSWTSLNKNLKSVYIDTGENGIFSSGEFETITSVGQMEFVTPEEIAENVILEILGDNTGHDIVNALDNSIMGPTYRAGYMRHHAMNKMEQLKGEFQSDSIAFEILGPPRLSKLLYEAHILNKICGNLKDILNFKDADLSKKSDSFINHDQKIRSHALSIGIPILLSDGKRLLRGPEIKIPPHKGGEIQLFDIKKINEWADAGWIDFRTANMRAWQKRVTSILNWVKSLPKEDSSSRFVHGAQYWDSNKLLNIGKIAAWIFMNEDDGLRFKR